MPEINAERFWKRVRTAGPDDCWEWTPPYTVYGYGQQFHGGRMWVSHRVSWVLHHGEIPDGLHVCHHCDNRKCVNPAHLFLGTDADNLRDMRQKGRGFSHPKGYRAGIKHWRAKLTDESVREIRRVYVGRYGQLSQLGRKYGVPPSCIDAVVRRRTWTHIA